MMQSVLKSINKERAMKNEVVKTWIQQLRDAAFHVEDWVELVAHVDPHRSKVSMVWSAICRKVPSWAVPGCVAPARSLDEAAEDMKTIKARVEDLRRQNIQYRIFSSDDGGSGTGLDSNKATAAANINWSQRAFKILRNLWLHELGRFRWPVGNDNLITLLIHPNGTVRDADLQVIWLWGGDEDGRDLFIHIDDAYHHPATSEWFHHRAWVKITRPYKQEKLIKTLQNQLAVPSNGATTTSLTSDTQCSMQPAGEMNEKRYLVVVEHVSNLEELNAIRMCLPPEMSKKGSRILVSTQHLMLPIHYAAKTKYLVTELFSYYDDRPSVCALYKKVN
jgi:hypothetical protein